jgi:hypothetical protein
MQWKLTSTFGAELHAPARSTRVGSILMIDLETIAAEYMNRFVVLMVERVLLDKRL